MKRIAWLLLLVAITGCSPPYANPHADRPVARDEVRLSMEQVNPGNARADAARALGRGDRHLLGVHGYGSLVPGVDDPAAAGRPVLFIEDTGDEIRDFGHARFNKKAAAYALVYNQELLRAEN